jgi:hypothetical protein
LLENFLRIENFEDRRLNVSKKGCSRIILVIIALAVSYFLCYTSAWSAKTAILDEAKAAPDQSGKPIEPTHKLKIG